jgi:hypothetical protein
LIKVFIVGPVGGKKGILMDFAAEGKEQGAGSREQGAGRKSKWRMTKGIAGN